MQALTLQHINKSFTLANKSQIEAVRDVSLTIAPGSIHGLLGPNGAGKSTIISMVSGMITPDTGSISLFGEDVVAHPERTKAFLGIVPQEIVVEMAFTVKEVLYYFSGMYGVPASQREVRIREVLQALDLESKMDERARNLSGGMKRRLMIAKAILHRPKFLILDEPTAGVDVTLRQRIWSLVRQLNAEGTTILFTTHYLEEAENLCEAITLIDHGQVIKDGKLKDIQQEFSKNAIHFELYKPTTAHLPGVVPVGTEFEYPMTNLAADTGLLTAHYGDNMKSLRSEAASLESIFIKLTNQSV
ncbi:MAG: ABC transporter ATP-binding protein [Patescibacteria group bacterium]